MPYTDNWSTCEFATEALLQRESFSGLVWECACGDGRIVRVLRRHGLKVWATDIVPQPGVDQVCDFLTTKTKLDSIITNPPYSQKFQFAAKAVLRADKVALLLPLYFLESNQRRFFFRESPPKAVYVFSQRIYLFRNGYEKFCSLPSAWFVWERGFAGEPVIRWITPQANGPPP